MPQSARRFTVGLLKGHQCVEQRAAHEQSRTANALALAGFGTLPMLAVSPQRWQPQPPPRRRPTLAPVAADRRNAAMSDARPAQASASGPEQFFAFMRDSLRQAHEDGERYARARQANPSALSSFRCLPFVAVQLLRPAPQQPYFAALVASGAHASAAHGGNGWL